MQSNTFNEDRLDGYQSQAMSTRIDSCDNLTYMLLGLVAEVGELSDKVAKWKRKKDASVINDGIVFNTCDTDEVDKRLEELILELGDVLWFVAGLADYLGYSLSEVANMNLRKLFERKSQGTIISHTDH